MAKNLQKQVEKVTVYVRNADHLTDILRAQTIDPEDLLVNFNLFIQVFTTDTLTLINKVQIQRTYYQAYPTLFQEHIFIYNS